MYTNDARRTDGTIVNAFCLALFILVFCILAHGRGSDANWDFRNYHLYGPFALLHSKIGYDLAPAQVQTFLAPMLDLLLTPLRVALNDHPRTLNVALAVPHGVAAFFAFAIARKLLAETGRLCIPLALAAAAIGATGAAGLPTLAASNSEMIPASFLLAGVNVLLAQVDADKPGRWFLAGALVGIAVGLKLTLAPFCAGALVALIVTASGPWFVRCKQVVVFGVAAALAATAVAGPWWLILYNHYESPIFPFYNKWFRSPYYDAINLTDDRFRPRTLVQALFYPFFWAVHAQTLVAEAPMRDPRIALGALGVAATVLRKIDRKTALFIIFFAMSYILWEIAFSIYRYLAPLELLSGVAVLLPFRPLLTTERRQRAAFIALALFLFVLLRVTIYPDWGHAARSRHAVDVRMPNFPANSLVAMLDSAPTAYLATFAPPSVRFVGAHSNLIHPGDRTLLAQQIEGMIRGHQGPLWGLEDPSGLPGEADETLRYYGLVRGIGCVQIHSNLDSDSIRLCPLKRGS
jgi:hypothetical protein